VHRFDGQVMRGEHLLEVWQCELGDALDVLERPAGARVDDYLLEEMTEVGPPGQAIRDAVDLLDLLGRQRRFGLTDVQVVEHQPTAVP
jgi:hypothetical protein